MRIEIVTDIEVFRPLGELWMQQHNGKNFGFNITVDDVMADAKALIDSGAGACIGANFKAEWVGFMLLFMTQSFLGPQTIAVEKYWFAKPEQPMAGPLMLREARLWAKRQGCSHLIMSASNLASAMHDKVCEFYEKAKLMKFETSYITEIN